MATQRGTYKLLYGQTTKGESRTGSERGGEVRETGRRTCLPKTMRLWSTKSPAAIQRSTPLSGALKERERSWGGRPRTATTISAVIVGPSLAFTDRTRGFWGSLEEGRRWLRSSCEACRPHDLVGSYRHRRPARLATQQPSGSKNSHTQRLFGGHHNERSSDDQTGAKRPWSPE